MIRILNTHWFLFFVCVGVLWLNFGGHIFSSLPLQKFIEGEFESERFAVSRLIYNLDHGHEAKGGFMLHYDNVRTIQNSTDRNDFQAFKEGLNDETVSLYLSHAGVQDDVLRPLWMGLTALKAKILEHARPGSRWESRMQTLDLYYFVLVSWWFVALLNALALSLFVLWVAKTFHMPTAWGVLVFALIALPVLTYYGRSIWWMMWSWYLPLLITLWWLYFRPGFRWFDAVGAGSFAAAAIAFKVTMGYEFSSTVMMGVLIAPVFYALKDHWSWQKWFRASFVLGVLGLCGFAAGLFYHYTALQEFGVNPMDVLQQRFTMRAHGGADVPGGMIESVEASVFGVILGYLVSPKELMPPQILLMAPFLWMLWNRRRSFMDDRVFAALSAAIGFGFIGALSMLVILKGHAYIHGFDVVVWSIPMNLFLGIVYARALVEGRFSGSKP